MKKIYSFALICIFSVGLLSCSSDNSVADLAGVTDEESAVPVNSFAPRLASIVDSLITNKPADNYESDYISYCAEDKEFIVLNEYKYLICQALIDALNEKKAGLLQPSTIQKVSTPTAPAGDGWVFCRKGKKGSASEALKAIRSIAFEIEEGRDVEILITYEGDFYYVWYRYLK